jgi:hypothetical protein
MTKTILHKKDKMEKEKKRLQFDFTDEALEVLDRLQKSTGLHTRAELIRHALRFLQWAVDETNNKNATLLVERDGNVREVILPWTIGSQPRAALSGSSGAVADRN